MAAAPAAERTACLSEPERPRLAPHCPVSGGTPCCRPGTRRGARPARVPEGVRVLVRRLVACLTGFYLFSLGLQGRSRRTRASGRARRTRRPRAVAPRPCTAARAHRTRHLGPSRWRPRAARPPAAPMAAPPLPPPPGPARPPSARRRRPASSGRACGAPRGRTARPTRRRRPQRLRAPPRPRRRARPRARTASRRVGRFSRQRRSRGTQVQRSATAAVPCRRALRAHGAGRGRLGRTALMALGRRAPRARSGPRSRRILARQGLGRSARPAAH